jgi:hypothetical protein
MDDMKLEEVKFEELIGKTLVSVSGKVGDDEMLFETDDGESYRLYHQQECCEGVTIEDIAGDINDLLGHPILMAEEAKSRENPEGVRTEHTLEDSFTWTFYKLSTIKASVTIRWYGASNGYYSEDVDFVRVVTKEVRDEDGKVLVLYSRTRLDKSL